MGPRVVLSGTSIAPQGSTQVERSDTVRCGRATMGYGARLGGMTWLRSPTQGSGYTGHSRDCWLRRTYGHRARPPNQRLVRTARQQSGLTVCLAKVEAKLSSRVCETWCCRRSLESLRS